MSVGQLLIRLLIGYPFLLMAVGAFMNLIGKSGHSFSVIILGCLTNFMCVHFAKTNKRYFSSGEKAYLVFGIVFIDLFVQGLFSVFVLGGLKSSSAFASMMIALNITALLDLIVMYLVIGFTKKHLVNIRVIK